MTGDNPSAKYCLFPWLDHVIQMDGTPVEITPLTDGSLPFLEGPYVTDLFSAYDAHYKALALAERPEPEFLLPSHDPENIYRRYFC